MKLPNVFKPAIITSVGLVSVAASNLLTEAPDVLVKIGWGLVIFGSVWFLSKTKK